MVAAGVPAEAVRQAVQQAAEKAAGKGFAVDPVTIFDVFTGKGVGEGKKSVACGISFRSVERTLEDKEVNAAFEEVQRILSETTGYSLRT